MFVIRKSLSIPFSTGKKHQGAELPSSNGLQQHPFPSHPGWLIPMCPQSLRSFGSILHCSKSIIHGKGASHHCFMNLILYPLYQCIPASGGAGVVSGPVGVSGDGFGRDK